MRGREKVNFLSRSSINYAELDKELKVEIAVLGGLDIFTNAHVVGVVKNTTMICDALGLDYNTTKKLILSAYMHDVGKILVPSEVLQKNGKLTDEEYEIMKKHTVYGYDICMKYDQFKFLAPIVRGHHENLDGSGYPDGLKGKEIPEEAKLIKIADIYDALTQRRQYKDGFKPSKAVEIILEGVRSGKTGSKYLYYLLLCVINEFEEKSLGNVAELEKAEEDLQTLKELDEIYKKIYDQGYTKKNESLLNRYNLSPGYDMTTNTNLLIRTQKKIELLRTQKKEDRIEINTLKKQLKEAKRRIKLSERFVRLFGKLIF